MSNLTTALSQLDSAWKRLDQRWTQTNALWNDPVSRSFEKDYWQPLESQSQAVQKEMERLAQVIAKARQSVK